MAMQSFNINLSLNITASGSRLPTTTFSPLLLPISNQTAAGYGANTYALVAGNNDTSIAVPAGTFYYLIVPDPESTNNKTISQQPATFNGITFTNQALLLPVGVGQQYLDIYSVGADAITVYWI